MLLPVYDLMARLCAALFLVTNGAGHVVRER